MALILLGQSKCPICDQVLMDNNSLIALPAISDVNHPLWEYFDNGFHTFCFNNWDKKSEILKILEQENIKF